MLAPGMNAWHKQHPHMAMQQTRAKGGGAEADHGAAINTLLGEGGKGDRGGKLESPGHKMMWGCRHWFDSHTNSTDPGKFTEREGWG